MARLRIKNWKSFQHYDHRCPPWIKLHFKILHSRDWVSASDTERVLAIACMLIASQDDAKDGSFEADPEYFQRVAYLNSLPKFETLISRGFLEMLADASESKQKIQNGVTETETEKSNTPPTPSKEGGKRKRRNRIEILSPYPKEVSEVVNELLTKWPSKQPATGSPITPDLPQLAEKIDRLLKEPNVTKDVLLGSADRYLAEKKNYYKHPQFFFGAGNGETSHWTTYARMLVHEQQVTQ